MHQRIFLSQHWFLLLSILFHLSPVAWASDVLSLEDCTKLALDRHHDLRNAERHTALARLARKDAMSWYLPSLNASFSSSQTRVGPQLNNQAVFQGIQLGNQEESQAYTTNSHFIGTTFSQLLFDGGAAINRIRKENALLEAATLTETDTRAQVILQCTQLFYSMRQAEEQARLAENNLSIAEMQLQRTERLRESGQLAKLDLFRSRVLRNNAKLGLMRAVNTLTDTRIALNTFLGRGAELPLTLKPGPEQPERLSPAGDLAAEHALDWNFQIRSLRQEIQARRLGISAARNAYFPSINFTGSYYRYNSALANVYSNLSKNYSVFFGLTLNYNLFDGLRRETSIQREFVMLALTEERLAAAQEDVVSRILRKRNLFTSQLDMLQLQEENLFEADEAVRVARQRYESGQATLLEVQQAEQSLANAKYLGISLRFEALITRAELDALLGNDSH